MTRFPAYILPVLLMAGSSAALAQTPGARPSDHPMEHAATTPLRDLNLTKDKVPPLLEQILPHPYAAAGLNSCAQIAAHVRQLDQVLGADVDQVSSTNKDGTAAWVTGEVATSIIPGEGIIRHVTGADKNAQHFAAAVYAGSVRRGFLKGMGLSKGCRPPAAPR